MFVNKILSKYIYVGSCFEEFIIRNKMMQSEFNLDTYFIGTTFQKFRLFIRATLIVVGHAVSTCFVLSPNPPCMCLGPCAAYAIVGRGAGGSEGGGGTSSDASTTPRGVGGDRRASGFCFCVPLPVGLEEGQVGCQLQLRLRTNN
jgi:hypothetical protein